MTMTHQAAPDSVAPDPAAAPTTAPGGPRRPARAMPAPDVQRTLLALLASMLGVFPLCELFTDRGWLIDVWLTMAVVVAPAAWLRRTRAPSAGQIWIGVLLLVPWLTGNFVREHAFLGFIPLHGSWTDISALLTDLHSTTTDEVAPVHTTVAVRLAVCALLGLTAALVDLLAVVGRRGALAGVPLLIVFTVSGAVPRQPVSWRWFTLSAVGFLVLLALDSSDDLHRWGHYVARSRQAGRRRLSSYSGQRIAVIAILLAVALPLAIPSDSRNLIANWFHNDPTNDGFGAGSNGGGSGTGGIDPFVTLKGQLTRPKNVDLLNVTVKGDSLGGAKDTQPFYVRTNVLSRFTGKGWRAEGNGDTQSIGDTVFASSPGTAVSPKTVRYTAQIEVTGLRSNPPIFASPTKIDGVDGNTRWSPRNMLLVGPRTNGGQRITEQVAQPAPTVDDLRSATGVDPALNPWLRLDVPVAPYVRQLTRSITGNARTPYERARAITTFFADPANNFQYSLTTTAGDSGDDLTDFLRNRLGYCQQYAAAMAVMLRLAGVPSRVVLGYAHGVPDSTGSFTITGYDAHAWVEAYFEGFGWIPFDPTPIAGISGGAANDLSWAPHSSGSAAPTGGLSGQPSATALPTRNTRPEQIPTSTTAAPAADSTSFAPLVVLLVIVLALVAIALIPATMRWRRRRHRLRLARAGDAEALWAELADAATDLGYVWSSARTPRQVAAWLGGSREDPTGSLHAITSAVERARYAPLGAGAGSRASVLAPDRPRDLTADLAAVVGQLRMRRTPRERWRSVLWPASLGWLPVWRRH